MFAVEPSRSGHAWQITVDALQAITGARGQVRYASAKCPMVGLRKRRLPLVFTVHAMHRLAERNTMGTGDYSDTRSTFNLLRGVMDFDVVRSAPGQWLVAVFWPCTFGYATWFFAEQIMPTRRPDVPYKFRFGYLAVEEEGGTGWPRRSCRQGTSGRQNTRSCRRHGYPPVPKRGCSRSVRTHRLSDCARAWTLPCCGGFTSMGFRRSSRTPHRRSAGPRNPQRGAAAELCPTERRRRCTTTML